MPERAFTITELRRTSTGTYDATPVRFSWTVEERNLPKKPWSFGLKQRTVRTDYVGADRPTEQVLGPAFKAFAVQGRWDDRRMGLGRALETWRAFEALAARGSMVRVAFETVSVDGIITDVDFDYRASWDIGYNFTLSPHVRSEGAAAGEAARGVVPVTLESPQALAAKAMEAAEEAQALQDDAPVEALETDIATVLGDQVAGWLTALEEATTAIDQRFLGGNVGALAEIASESVDALSRLAQTFATIRTAAQDTLTSLASARSDLDMAYETAVGVLDFEVWTRGLGQQARLLILRSDAAAQELASRVDPKARAVYRPRKGESLYGISQRFYGTPHHWREIAERNGLTTLTLQGTELLVIPEATS